MVLTVIERSYPGQGWEQTTIKTSRIHNAIESVQTHEFTHTISKYVEKERTCELHEQINATVTYVSNKTNG